MIGMSEVGDVAESAGPGGRPYGGPLPGATVRGLRRALCEALAEAGFARGQIDQVVVMSESSVRRSLAGPGPEPDASLPPEVPPGIGPPGPYRRPAGVRLSERFVRDLRRDYGRGVATDEGRPIGDLPEVAAWLESLSPGQFLP